MCVEFPDDGLDKGGALGYMSSAYWHAVTGRVTHRASPPYSHVSGHAGAAGRVCKRPTALATSITHSRPDGKRFGGIGGGGGGGVVVVVVVVVSVDDGPCVRRLKRTAARAGKSRIFFFFGGGGHAAKHFTHTHSTRVTRRPTVK